MNEIVKVISIVGTISSIIFSILAFKRSERRDIKKEGKNEGLIISEIGYIKSCIDRMEKNINQMEKNNLDFLQRIIKLEESLSNIKKQVDSKIIKKGG